MQEDEIAPDEEEENAEEDDPLAAIESSQNEFLTSSLPVDKSLPSTPKSAKKSTPAVADVEVLRFLLYMQNSYFYSQSDAGDDSTPTKPSAGILKLKATKRVLEEKSPKKSSQVF